MRQKTQAVILEIVDLFFGNSFSKHFISDGSLIFGTCFFSNWRKLGLTNKEI